MAESDSTARVGLVFVSHSSAIAHGLVELARQMAPTITLDAAGGTDDDRIGTSFDRVKNGIEKADSGAGVVVLCDMGSSILTAETVLDFLDSTQRQRVKIANAPLVEGGVAAAVAAETGGAIDDVLAAAQSTPELFPSSSDRKPTGFAGSSNSIDEYRRSTTLRNKDGLHARPAADFVRLASSFDTRVTVNGKDAKSLLSIMSLGLNKGDVADIAADAQTGRGAVDALIDLIESGFAEH